MDSNEVINTLSYSVKQQISKYVLWKEKSDKELTLLRRAQIVLTTVVIYGWSIAMIFNSWAAIFVWIFSVIILSSCLFESDQIKQDRSYAWHKFYDSGE